MSLPISRFAGFCVLRGEFFGQLVYVHGLLVRLLGEFVRGHVISFTVRDSSRGVGMGSKVVELCDSIVRTLWHGVLLADGMAALRARFGFTQRCLAGVPILFRDVVLRHLARSHLRHIRVLGVFHTIHSVGFERVSLFY